nr:D-Ala-D-Ala carboxypeptidase family metallohydrolase [Puniceibacterium confluentis]
MAALDKLQALRDRLGKPLIVRSACRRPEHDRAVGGATRSKHLDGTAFDIAMTNHGPVAVEAAARAVGMLGFVLTKGRPRMPRLPDPSGDLLTGSCAIGVGSLDPAA